jgi:outer membrane protein assembly factor BamB
MKRSRIPAALLALAVSVAAQPGSRPGSRAWTMFRGTPRLWGTTGAPLPDRLELRWTYQAKESIESSAAIAGGVAYVGSQDGTLHAVDLATGKARWQYKTQGPVGESSPCVADGTVYVGDLDGVLHAVDAATGAPRWTFKTDAEIKSSPNAAGDRILFGSYDSHLYCLSRAGKLLWKYQTNGPVHCTPAIDANRTFVTGCDEVFRALDLATGNELFSVPLGAYTGASPAVRDDAVYVGTFGNEVVCLDLGRRAVRWTYRHPDRTFPFYSSAAIAPDRIVIGGRDKLVHCLDRATGKALWTFATRSRVESSPLLDGGRVFIGSNDGHLYALELTTGKKLWDFTAGAPISASPAAAEGALVVGSQDGALYGFGAAGAARP